MTVPETLPRRAVADYLVGIVRLLGYGVELKDLQVSAPEPVPPPPPPGRSQVPLVSEEIRSLALASPLTPYGTRFKGGADTWDFDGGEFCLAVQAFLGDESVDQRLLEQVRFTLKPGNEPTCTGGFPDQKQVGGTGTLLLALRNDRILEQLTVQEVDKATLILRAALAGGAWTCSDSNPLVQAGGNTKQYALDGAWVGRDWNPNYQNGFVGQCIVGGLHGLGNAQTFLANYVHSEFVDDLRSFDCPNIVETFTSGERGEANAPKAAAIEQALRGFSWYGIPVSEPMRMYRRLTEHTFGGTVSAGLASGAGVAGPDGRKGGMLTLSAQAGLPNLGELGMLHEFSSSDANGPRSSKWYAFDGWWVNNQLHMMLVLLGAWKDGVDLVERIEVGTTDLWYKDQHGYVDYFKGQVRGTVPLEDKHGRRIHQELYRTLSDWHAREGV